MDLTYAEELALLAAELLADNPTLTPEQAAALALTQMEDLYRAALDWNLFVAALRPIRPKTI